MKFKQLKNQSKKIKLYTLSNDFSDVAIELLYAYVMSARSLLCQNHQLLLDRLLQYHKTLPYHNMR